VAPQTEYAKAPDGVHLAYQVVGDGPVDLVFLSEWTTHLEAQWEYPPLAAFLDRLSSFSRVLLFDKRGIGLSDPLPLSDVPTLERHVEDISVAMDAAQFDSAIIFATGGAGPMALVHAATHPDRTRALILANTFARLSEAEGYAGVNASDQAAFLSSVESGWGTGAITSYFAPSHVDDAMLRSWLGRYQRLAASPGLGMRMQAQFFATDVRQVLPAVRVPTLIVHRSGNRFVPSVVGRYLADQIAGAQFVELAGDEHLYYVGDADSLLDEVEQLATGALRSRATDRLLATVMFTDIVDSTDTAARLGDAHWRQLLDAHDAMTRRQLQRFRGREIQATGDGFLATFDGPARAIKAALAIRTAAIALGLRVRIGVHTGEVEQRDMGIGGIAVHVAQRVMALAQPNEVLASSTVKDLVIGSGIRFQDRGFHILKGVPDQWRLLEVIEDR
jgi:class 3 adenylate cyclase